MNKTSYLFLAEGFEEIEALATVDILRRAGIKVETVAITSDPNVAGAHGIRVTADDVIGEIDADNADWLICPGGLPGSTNLAECETLCRMLVEHDKRGGNIAAICAAPAMVLAPLGLLDGRQATGYPGTTGVAGIEWLDQRVVTSGNIITGNGPSSALPFALAIAAKTAGTAVADQVAAGMLV